MSALVIRFSSLGDVVLAASVTPSIGSVVFATHARFVPVVQRFQGVSEVIGLEQGEGLMAYAARLPSVERTLDLHSSLRSRVLASRVGAPVSRVDKCSLTRRWRVAFKRPERIPTVLERYAGAAGVPLAPRPWISIPRSETLDSLVLVPGAAHETKRWPLAHYRALAMRWDGPLFALGSLSEEPLLRQLSQETDGRVVPVAERGFEQAFKVLEGAGLVVGGDTGLVHLAAACGVPVISLFGPTHSADGFWNHPGQAVELDMACRPCSLHGGKHCPIGDHACMEDIGVDQVWKAIAQVRSDHPARVGL